MKKLAVFGLVLMLFMSVGYAAPTTVDMDWIGGGAINVNTTSGDDATSSFSTFGAGGFSGNLFIKDHDNNPYNYGVDNFETYANAQISGGGYITLTTERLDSNETPEPGTNYGPAGQFSHDYVYMTGDSSWGAMAMGSQSNFASMKQNTYGKGHTANGFNYEVENADIFSMGKVLSSDSDVENAERSLQLSALGTGSGKMYILGSELNDPDYKGDGLNLGIGCGHNHPNFKPKYYGDGVGSLTLSSKGTDYIVVGKQTPSDTAYHTKVTGSGFVSLVETSNYIGTFEKLDLGTSTK